MLILGRNLTNGSLSIPKGWTLSRSYPIYNRVSTTPADAYFWQEFTNSYMYMSIPIGWTIN